MKKFLHASVFALALLASPALFAQDAPSDNASSDTPLAAGGTTGSAERGGKWREAFAKLDLTEAQKQQIQQIRTSTSPGKERRQQIMAVLTPAQKEKLVAMFKAYRAEQGGADQGAP
jgi:Spy/CpxP family protein refolding chaperone